MKLATLLTLFLLLCALDGRAQAVGAMRIASVAYDRVAPGQIVELRVEGLGEQLVSPPPGEALRVLVTQDGETRAASVRTAVPVFVRAPDPPNGAVAPDLLKQELIPYQGLTFVLPKGLRAGEAEVVVSFRGRKSAPFKLNVVERPQRPFVGTTAIAGISPGTNPTAPPPADAASRQRTGLRFERGAKGVAVHVRPLADPDDAEAGVIVRFKQGGAFYDAPARVVHLEGGRERVRGGFGLTSPHDALEIDVPELLAPGEAEMEVTLRAGGQTGEAALVPVTITDAERAFESPQAAAPRLLAVNPRRVGAGQALTLSVDRRRSLDPDPSKAVVVFETPDGASSYKAAPEINSAVLMPSTPPDAPVFILVRAPRQLSGAVRVRLVNPARADYEGASSEPVQIELVQEALAPEVLGAAEASADELARLRELAAAQPPGSRMAPVYDPSSRYVSVRVKGIDPNPSYVRMRFEQEGRAAATLVKDDFVLYTGGSVVVRLPKGFAAGAVRVTVENLGASGYSAPSAATFQLPERR